MESNDDLYDSVDWSLDYSEHQSAYRIGRGEFGVMMYEPYTDDIGQYWKYKNADVARESIDAIKPMFDEYLDRGEFPGADMSRKFIQMGWTRALRYAKYPGGKKYVDGDERDAQTWYDESKYEASQVYKSVYDEVRQNDRYLRLKEMHRNGELYGQTELGEYK
jgi:hypothetical protein